MAQVGRQTGDPDKLARVVVALAREDRRRSGSRPAPMRSRLLNERKITDPSGAGRVVPVAADVARR
jgi:hypothetical protein